MWNKDHEDLAPLATLALTDHDFLNLRKAYCIFTGGAIQALALPLSLPRCVHERRSRNRL